MRFHSILLMVSLGLYTGLVLLPSRASAQEEKKQENPIALVQTSLGEFKIELYQKEAPISVKNFLDYVDKKFYDGTIFHRVIPTFMIQGGGFTPDMIKKATSPPIRNEANNGLSNLKMTVAMARTGEPHSASSQFFINVKDNTGLDFTGEDNGKTWGYAVFGKVIDGWETCEKIRRVQTTKRGMYSDVPEKPVVIEKIRRWYPEDEEEE